MNVIKLITVIILSPLIFIAIFVGGMIDMFKEAILMTKEIIQEEIKE